MSNDTTKEIWKDIPEFKGIYQVSNLGRIKRIVDSHTNGKAGQIIKPVPQKGKYLNVTLRKDNQNHYRSVARLVASAFLGDCPSGKEINHLNGNRQDNRINNLQWVTRSENIQHSYDVLKRSRDHHKTSGENNSAHKLTTNDVLKIRSLYSSGNYSQDYLGKVFNVSQAVISSLILRKTWKRV